MFLALVWVRAFYGSMKNCREGQAFFEKERFIKAITFFDRSLHWYTPFNAYVTKSAEGLWQISKRAEAKGDIRLSLMAARTLRRGFVAARSFYTPGKDWIKRCDERIGELLMIQRKQMGKVETGEIQQNAILDHPQVRGPNVLWSLILIAALLGWIGSALVLIFPRFGAEKKRKSVGIFNVKWVITFAFFWFIWLLAMMRA